MLKKLFIMAAVLLTTACQCNSKHDLKEVSSLSNRIEMNDQEYRQVFFGLDSVGLDVEARKKLDLQVSWLKNNPEVNAVIEGYCDERGSEKYNIILGEKRASAVKDYLVSNGIDAARLKTVSYGKNRPILSESNEEAWAMNRRSVTITKQ